MIKWFIEKRERHYAMLNDNRVVRPFRWGIEHLNEGVANPDELEFLIAEGKRAVEESEEFFRLGETPQYEGSDTEEEDDLRIKWNSAVPTLTAENNSAYARFFRSRGDRKAAVVVLPHWNAMAGSYFDLCGYFKKFGVSALRLTLPYHEERMPPELERADHLVSPDIGRTVQSVRQCVLDTRAAVRWLRLEGYERVGVVGTSIGSCVAFLAFVHDESIECAVFNHVSGMFADVVWRGLSTYHVREGLEGNISLDDLRACWLGISPLAYIDRLSVLPPRPQRYIYTKYDLSFPPDLSRLTMTRLRKAGIEHDETVFPCGHYTLGEKPWIYLDGYKIISFLRRHLRR